jgi:hypothetical protein
MAREEKKKKKKKKTAMVSASEPYGFLLTGISDLLAQARRGVARSPTRS